MQINFRKLHFSSSHFSSKNQKTKVTQKKKKILFLNFSTQNQTLRVKIKISSITQFLISFIFLITNFLIRNQTHP